MKVQPFVDDEIRNITLSNLDAFLADLKSDPQQTEIAKSVKANRAAEDLEILFGNFEETMQLAACGRTGTGPRLRSERTEAEPTWKPGMDENLGLEKRAGDRKKYTLKAWMAEQFALGRTANELIEHAAGHDQQTAELLRELATQIENE
jgi:hypothetical protein